MRTTVDIDEDVLRTVRELAREREESLGRVLSNLARRGLEPEHFPLGFDDGVPTLPPVPGGKPITMDQVKELMNQDD